LAGTPGRLRGLLIVAWVAQVIHAPHNNDEMAIRVWAVGPQCLEVQMATPESVIGGPVAEIQLEADDLPGLEALVVDL
jgi:hypothetical protein